MAATTFFQAVVWIGGRKILIGARNVESADFTRLVADVANQSLRRACGSRNGRKLRKHRSPE
jgi:hypothetical protein